MNNKVLFGVLVGLLLIGTLSAMSIKFYHSDTCPHCRDILPIVKEKIIEYPQHTFGLYEINSDEDNRNAFLKYNFAGVPAFVIKTNDCREVTFVGADKRRLKCELQEMSTQECPTYSDYPRDGSWFIN